MIGQSWRRSAESICLPCGAVLFALVLFGVFCTLAGANPFGVYHSIFRAAFGSPSRIQGTLILAAPLMLTALCTALPFKLGLVVIGNEGALVMGGLGAIIAGLALESFPPPLVLLSMALSSILFGGLWIGLVGFLRHYRGVNETISSLLMNFLAIAILSHLVEGPMRDPSSLNKPSSFPIIDPNRLGTIPGTRVHLGLIFGLVACFLAFILIQRTTFGFAARVAGGNMRAAKIAGLPVGQLTLAICFLAGACAGLAGMVEVAAIHGVANQSLNANYGYSGILVAFIARSNALAVTLVAFLLGGILASGGILQRSHDLPDATVLVFQGLVFLVVLYSESLYGRFALFKEPEIPASATKGQGESAVAQT